MTSLLIPDPLRKRRNHRWEINNGQFTYSDATMPAILVIKDVNHRGSGDFNQDEFDLKTSTTADSVTFSYDGIAYVKDKKVTADAVINISEDYSLYRFSENNLSINDFRARINGEFRILENGYDMDLTAEALDNSFKSLLSLVPGIYTEDFGRIRANGILDFSAAVKGIYNDERIPAFDLSLQTKNSMFQYPDLPRAVENISLDLGIRNSDGIMENTSVNLREFHADFGNNPIDARLIIENLRDYTMDGNIQAKLDLADITTIFPVEATQIKGIAEAAIEFSGRYDSVSNIMPAIDGNVSLKDGYVKSADLPYALEKVQLVSTIRNETGQMQDFDLLVNPFSMQLDGAPFRADGRISNLLNYTWNVNAQGSVDLRKLASVLQITDFQMEGQLMADVHTQGNMDALNAERYADLPTSGDITLRGFKYSDEGLPETFEVSEAALNFDPSRLNLVRFASKMGGSDFNVTGYISNYLGYALGENKVLRGRVDLVSEKIDLNAFMSEEESVSDDQSPASVIEVPENVDMTLSVRAGEVLLTNMVMRDMRGIVNIKDESVIMDGLRFNMLGGTIVSRGLYSTVSETPAYEFGLDVEKVRIAEAFQTFSLVKTYAPIAEKLQGMFSTELSLSGKLLDDMSPDLGTVNADGLVEVLGARLEGSNIVEKVASLTKLEQGETLEFDDLTLDINIRDGKLQVDPFKVNLWGYSTEISGATALDGSIAYQLTMMVPAGKMGESLNSFLAQYADAPASDDLVPVTIGLGGTYTSPEAVLLMDDQKELIEEALKQKLSDEAMDKSEEMLEQIKDEKTRDILSNILGKKPVNDSLKADSVKADSTAVPVKEDVQQEAVEKIRDFFKKKKKDNSEEGTQEDNVP